MPSSDNDDIESRVALLEREMIRLREQVALTSSEAAAARVLAAGADHDVSEVRAELRAHTQVLNALRETQLELDAKVNKLDATVNKLDATVNKLDATVTRLDEKVSGLDEKVSQGFGTLATGMAQITALLTPNAGSGQN